MKAKLQHKLPKIKLSPAVIIFFVLILVVIFFYLSPILILLMSSLKEREQIIIRFNPFEGPKHLLNFKNYINAAYNLNYWQSLFNTTIVTLITVVFTCLFSVFTAYAIARGIKKKSRYFKVLYYIFLLGLAIPYQAIFPSIYYLGFKLGLTNNPYLISVLYIGGLSLSVFIITEFIKNMDVTLEEAACIDGANLMQIIFYIVLPQIKSVLVSLVFLRAISVWNDYLLASSLLVEKSTRTLMVSFAKLFGEYSGDFATAFASIIIMELPIIILFIFLHKSIEEGIVAGAIKG